MYKESLLFIHFSIINLGILCYSFIITDTQKINIQNAKQMQTTILKIKRKVDSIGSWKKYKGF